MSQSGTYGSGSTPPGSVVQTLSGNAGINPVTPDGANNINVFGDTVTTNVSGDGLNTLTVSVTDNFASTYTTDDLNFAVPVAYNLNIQGAGGITTSSSGDTVTITGSGGGGITTINGDSGSITGDPVTIYANYAAKANGTLNFAGSGSTLTFSIYDAFGNIGFGNNAFFQANPGNNGIGIGNGALSSQTAGGTNNIAIGHGGLVLVTTGDNNVGVGLNTGGLMSTGSGNIFMGDSAGTNYSGAESYNILLNASGSSVNGESNVLRIGDGTGTGSKQLATAYISGISGVNVGSVASVVSINGDQLGQTVITAGSGISVTPAANTITIAATGGGGGGALVLIQTQTATGASTLDFTTGITSTYNNYRLSFSGFSDSGASGTTSFLLQISTNGGSTWITTGYIASGAAGAVLFDTITSTQTEGCGYVDLYNLTSGSGYVFTNGTNIGPRCRAGTRLMAWLPPAAAR